MTQAHWRRVLALIHAHRGEHADGRALAREAVALAEQTDGLNMQGDALCDLAQVLQAAGRNDEATATLRAGARTLRTETEPREGGTGS